MAVKRFYFFGCIIFTQSHQTLGAGSREDSRVGKPRRSNNAHDRPHAYPARSTRNPSTLRIQPPDRSTYPFPHAIPIRPRRLQPSPQNVAASITIPTSFYSSMTARIGLTHNHHTHLNNPPPHPFPPLFPYSKKETSKQAQRPRQTSHPNPSNTNTTSYIPPSSSPLSRHQVR